MSARALEKERGGTQKHTVFGEEKVVLLTTFLFGNVTWDAGKKSQEAIAEEIEELEAEIDLINQEIQSVWNDDSLTDKEKVEKVRELDKERKRKQEELNRLKGQ